MKEFITEEDKDIAMDYIIYQLLISALDRDIQAIKNSTLKLKNTHVLFMENIRDKVVKDLAKLKKMMFHKGIKVLEPKRINEDFWSYKYMVRGYESEFRCFVAALKMKTEKMLAHYYSLD